MELRALIVDDELDGIENLLLKINSLKTPIVVKHTCSDAKQAVKILLYEPIDILFLDIQMPQFSGFDLLDLIEEKNFKIVFVTAYSEFSLKAFRYAAFDYLLKPIDIDELKICCDRLEKEIITNNLSNSNNQQLEILKRLNETKTLDKLAINTASGLIILLINQINFIRADGAYCRIFTIDNKEYLVSKLLLDYEKILDSSSFIRAHHSYLVNANNVVNFDTKNLKIEFHNGDNVPISNRKKAAVLKKIATAFKK